MHWGEMFKSFYLPKGSNLTAESTHIQKFKLRANLVTTKL